VVVTNGNDKKACAYNGINKKCTKCCSARRHTQERCAIMDHKKPGNNNKTRRKPKPKPKPKPKKPKPKKPKPKTERNYDRDARRNAPRRHYEPEFAFAHIHTSLSGASRDYSFVRDLSILKDPNVWVGDTGASCNSTGYDYGMYDIRKANKGEGIMMGNAHREQTLQTGSISGAVCNKYGL
jgi:hypothetical protein